jgi:hypothetical protein
MTPEAPVTTFSFRDWLSGTRPVAGAAGACGLMLLACSWFVLAPGDIGDTGDVGSPPAVHLQQRHDAGRIAPPHSVAPAPQRDVGRHRSVTPRQAPPRALSTGKRNGRSAAPSAASSTVPVSAPTAQPHAAAPALAPTSAPTPAPATTLPAPVDEVPAISLPIPQVSAPQPPSVTVPDLGTTTTPLGLP